MSTPTDDPADFEACADHEQAYPIGGSCPKCPCECDEPDGYCDACDDEHGHTCIICGYDFCTPCWETPTHNDDCKRVVLADGSDAAALTGDEARELAKRWATEHEVKSIIDIALERSGVTQVHRRDLRRTSDAECERLFAWVREVIAADGTQVLENIDYHQAACVVCAALCVADDTEWVRGLLDAALARPS